MVTKQAVSAHILELLAQLAADWDYSGQITPETTLFSELGFQSLDAVILGNSLQEDYGHIIPYTDLLVEIGHRESADITVSEWVDFTYEHLHSQEVGVNHEV